MKFAWRQVALLTLLSWIASTPLLAKRGLDVVTRTYAEGSARFWSGISPYAPPSEARDWFKYSPAFAFLYTPFTALTASMHALAWSMLNCFFFWSGVAAWFRVSKKMPPLAWVALAACAMELDISLRYQQVNALLAGLMLLGLAAYRDKKFSASGAVLALAANFKILPFVFAGGLLWPPRRRYFWALLATLALLVALPMAGVGVARGLALHREWLALLGRDLGERGLLDLRTVLARWFPFSVAVVARFTVAAFSAVIFALYRLRMGRSEKFDGALWYGFGVCALLLLSPRTESPTFVLAAPVYAMLAGRAWSLGMKTLLLIIMLTVTVCYTDLWPKILWNPVTATQYATKTLGILALWGLCGWRLSARRVL